MAGDSEEPDAGRGGEGTELAEQVEGVGLVAGAPTAEHVAVEDDRTHPSSLHSSTTASATRSHVYDRARSRPVGTSSPRREIASRMPAAMAGTDSGSTRTAAPPAT